MTPISNNIPNGYRTYSALVKATQKAKTALPYSFLQRKAVVAELFKSFDFNTQVEIILHGSTIQNKPTKALSNDVINKIQLFYERDDVSRMSPDVKHYRKFMNASTGKKEFRQMRHLMYRLSEVYALFVTENMLQSGTLKIYIYDYLQS